MLASAVASTSPSWRQRWLSFIDGFVPPEQRADVESLARARLTISACLVAGACFLVTCLSLTPRAIPSVAIGNAVAATLCVAIAFWMRRGAAQPRAAHALLAVLFLFSAAIGGASGGSTSGPLYTVTVIPAIAVLLCGRRAGAAWAVAGGGLVLGIAGLYESGFTFPVQPEPDRLALANFAGVVSTMGGVLALALLYDWARERTLAELEETRRRSEQANRAFDARMRETQKLESLGVLAGGVAHDFNNLLTQILGNASLLTGSQDAETARIADDIALAAEQAGHLTDQLLAYAGRSRSVREPVQLDDLVMRVEPLARTAVRPDVELRLELADDPVQVTADSGQIQQVLLNLVTNAAEAIPGAGTVTVRTGVTVPRDGDLEATPFSEKLLNRACAFLEVEDDGPGMSDEVRRRIFDPFFTTKEMGRGLGLSALLGIVRSHEGAVLVDSARDRGARFRVLLPAEAAVRRVAEPAPPAPTVKGGTALVVDDDAAVRRFAARALAMLGFYVREAADGEEALGCLAGEPDLALMLLDATMPGLRGEDVLAVATQKHPGLPVILSTGDPEGFVDREPGSANVHWLPKPYGVGALRDTVARAVARE